MIKVIPNVQNRLLNAQCESHRWEMQHDVPLTLCLPITNRNQTVPCSYSLPFFCACPLSENWVLCVTSLLSLFRLPMDLLLFSLKITYLKNVYLKNIFTQYILSHSFFQPSSSQILPNSLPTQLHVSTLSLQTKINVNKKYKYIKDNH